MFFMLNYDIYGGLFVLMYYLFSLGFAFRRRFLLLWSIIIFSLLVILSQVIFLIVWAITGNKWSMEDSWWAELIGMMRQDLIALILYFTLIPPYLHVHVFFVRLLLHGFYMLLQNSIVEISLCNLLFGCTTIGGFCCISPYLWEQVFSGSMAGFILGTFLSGCWTFRFVTSWLQLRVIVAFDFFLQFAWNSEIYHPTSFSFAIYGVKNNVVFSFAHDVQGRCKVYSLLHDICVPLKSQKCQWDTVKVFYSK